MALKITCPHCSRPMRLDEPYPLPGAERQCGSCGRALAISYPMGMMDMLRQKGARFDEPAARIASLPPAPPAGKPDKRPPDIDRRADVDRRTESATIQERLPPDPGERTEVRGGHTGQWVAPEPPPRLPPEPTSAGRTGATAPAPQKPASRNLAAPIAAPPGAPPVITPVSPNAKAPPPPSKPPRPPAQPTGRSSRPPNNKPPAKRSWLKRLLASAVVLGLLMLALGGAAIAAVFWHYSQDLPTLETLANYRPPTVTVVYDKNHKLMGEIYEKRRYVVEMDEIPPHVRNAFLAAEDANFYGHGGIDYMGIVRAMGRNLLSGRVAQGASTITQQVARNFLLSSERTFERKIREVLLAWRIEEAFDKDHILYLYLNQIYLGSGAYGIEAASRVYFGKHVGELSVAEAAVLAGLPQRPSDYSPHRHFEKAKARQKYVLDQLAEKGFMSRADADAAYAEPLNIVERTNEFLLLAPWFTEHIRRYLVDTYGFDKVYNEGLIVESTCDLDLQKEAQKAVIEGVTSVDERTGWRGAAEHLEEADIAGRIEELKKKNNLQEGGRYAGVITEVSKKHLVVDLGVGKALVPLSWTEWAYKPDPSRSSKNRKQDDLTRAFSRGDVVAVEIVNRNFRDAKPFVDYKDAGDGPYAAASIYQKPELEGALYAYNLQTGAVIAMVGGVDFRGTEFNRAIQAQRQVGSTFKPVVYAAAIESRRFTAGSIVQDAPLAFNSLGSEVWKPTNYGEDYLGDITLRRALALSRNVVTIRVLDVVGLDPVAQMARRLGIESDMDIDLAMGLGAASLNLPEITRAYSAFATNGYKIEPHYIERVIDRDNNVLEAYQQPEWARVLDPGVATVMNWLLMEVASAGTASKAQRLGVHVAGKTGTTNEFRDAWFVGYTPEVIASVWVGYDTPKTIGASSTGGQIALPIWMDFMEEAFPKSRDRDFPGGGAVEWVSIDETTGRPMQGGRSMPFLSGTAPSGMSASAGGKTVEDLITSEF